MRAGRPRSGLPPPGSPGGAVRVAASPTTRAVRIRCTNRLATASWSRCSRLHHSGRRSALPPFSQLHRKYVSMVLLRFGIRFVASVGDTLTISNRRGDMGHLDSRAATMRTARRPAGDHESLAMPVLFGLGDRSGWTASDWSTPSRQSSSAPVLPPRSGERQCAASVLYGHRRHAAPRWSLRRRETVPIRGPTAASTGG